MTTKQWKRIHFYYEGDEFSPEDENKGIYVVTDPIAIDAVSMLILGQVYDYDREPYNYDPNYTLYEYNTNNDILRKVESGCLNDFIGHINSYPDDPNGSSYQYFYMEGSWISYDGIKAFVILTGYFDVVAGGTSTLVNNKLISRVYEIDIVEGGYTPIFGTLDDNLYTTYQVAESVTGHRTLTWPTEKNRIYQSINMVLRKNNQTYLFMSSAHKIPSYLMEKNLLRSFGGFNRTKIMDVNTPFFRYFEVNNNNIVYKLNSSQITGYDTSVVEDSYTTISNDEFYDFIYYSPTETHGISCARRVHGYAYTNSLVYDRPVIKLPDDEYTGVQTLTLYSNGGYWGSMPVDMGRNYEDESWTTVKFLWNTQFDKRYERTYSDVTGSSSTYENPDASPHEGSTASPLCGEFGLEFTNEFIETFYNEDNYKIAIESMQTNNLFAPIDQKHTTDTCLYDTEWEIFPEFYDPEEDIYPTFYGWDYIEQNGECISWHRTPYPDDNTDILTVEGPEHLIRSDIEKGSDYSLVELYTAILYTPDLYIYTDSDTVYTLYDYIEPSSGIRARPTSITVRNDFIYIGAATSGIITKPLVIETSIPPETSSSGDYTSQITSKNFFLGPSGYAFVKGDGGGCLAHGSLLPERVNYIYSGNSYDESDGLPEGGISADIEFYGISPYISINESIYVGNSGWSFETTTPSAVNTMLSDEYFMYLGMSGRKNPVYRGNIPFDDWDEADGNLPEYIVVTDLEGQFYDDR